MNKKLLAVAVAGALAVPGVALAQTAVTISGFFKVSADQVSYSGATAPGVLVNGGVGGGRYGNSSETRVSDNSSRIIFGVREELGNGLAAVAQVDMRFNPATNAAPVGNGAIGSSGQFSAAGNTWVGLQSTSWGRFTMGRRDLHYGKSGDSWNAGGAGSLQAWGSALFDVVGRPGAAAATAVGVAPPITSGVGIANQSRTPSAIVWDSPNWNGFEAIVAWSANPIQNSGESATGGDLGGATICNGTPCATTASGQIGSGANLNTTQTRRGQGWNINPKYNASNWGVEYSYWNAKADPSAASVQFANTQVGVGAAGTITQSLIPDDQRSDVIAGYFTMAGWKVGLGWNHAKTTNVASGLLSGDRTSWAIPISYTTGPHMIGYNYVRNNDSKDTCTAAGAVVTCNAGNGSNTGATMNTLTYEYNLSKRTALGLTWSQIQNKAAAGYGFFYNASTAFGSVNAGSLAGEKNRLLAATIMHRF